MYNTGCITPCLSHGRSGLSICVLNFNMFLNLYCPSREDSHLKIFMVFSSFKKFWDRSKYSIVVAGKPEPSHACLFSTVRTSSTMRVLHLTKRGTRRGSPLCRRQFTLCVLEYGWTKSRYFCVRISQHIGHCLCSISSLWGFPIYHTLLILHCAQFIPLHIDAGPVTALSLNDAVEF
jgi:hypothetical protein